MLIKWEQIHVEPVIMSKYEDLLAKHIMEHQQKKGIGKVNAFP